MLKTMPARVTVKNADLGEVEAVFATLNVIDKDGDVILPGAIDDGTTVALSSAHKAWDGAPAVGAGTIHEVDDELVVKGRYFMDTDHGRNAFHTVKGLAEHGLGEWSWSLEDVTATRGAWKTDSGTKPANIISRVGKVAEVSDVFRGAGQNTRTLVTKGTKQYASSLASLLRVAGRERWGDSADGWSYVWVEDYDIDAETVVFCIETRDGSRMVETDFTRSDTAVTLSERETDVHETVQFLPKGAKFSEHLTTVMADVKALADRAEGVMALRAAKGKSLSDEAGEALAEIAAQLQRVKALTEPTPPDNNPADVPSVDLDVEFARFVAMTQGVPL